MRKSLIILLLFTVGIWTSCNKKTDTAVKDVKLDNDVNKTGYGLGWRMGKDLKNSQMESNVDAIIMGLREGIKGDKSRLTDKEMGELALAFQNKAMKKRYASVIGEGEKFLTDNKTKEGVQVTSSGLQYQILKVGKGKNPSPTDVVKVHYKGTLLSGKEFDSSYSRNTPAEFPLNRVIRGWTEGLQLMKVGSKYKFFIPYNLAYGTRAMGKDIKPYSTLIFEVELLEIVDSKKKK